MRGFCVILTDMMSKLLLLEDDLSLVTALSFVFKKQGHELEVARTIREADALWSESKYDLLVLDVSLPDGTGFAFCEKVRQARHYVRLEALNWCKTAIPMGLALGMIVTWMLCAVLRFCVGEEFTDIPLFGISFLGIISGILVGLTAVLFAAGAPARRASKISPVVAVSGNDDGSRVGIRPMKIGRGKIETSLGMHVRPERIGPY